MEDEGIFVVKVFGKLGDAEDGLYSEEVVYWGGSYEAAIEKLQEAQNHPGMIKVTYEWIPEIEKLPIWSL